MIYVVGTDILLEAPRQGTSNEYPQHMFSWRRKKNINIFDWKKAPNQELWYSLDVDDTFFQPKGTDIFFISLWKTYAVGTH